MTDWGLNLSSASCLVPPLHFSVTFDTNSAHLRHICGTFAVHLRYICGTFLGESTADVAFDNQSLKQIFGTFGRFFRKINYIASPLKLFRREEVKMLFNGGIIFSIFSLLPLF